MTQAREKPVAESGLAAALTSGTEETANLSFAIRNARIVYSTYNVTEPSATPPQTSVSDLEELDTVDG